MKSIKLSDRERQIISHKLEADAQFHSQRRLDDLKTHRARNISKESNERVDRLIEYELEAAKEERCIAIKIEGKYPIPNHCKKYDIIME